MKKYKPVYVEWWDSSGLAEIGWKHETVLPSSDPVLCVSVGLLYEKTSKAIRLIGGYYSQPSGLIVDCVQDIPLVVIKRLRYLK